MCIKVYNKTEWWPVAEAVEAFARDFQGRQEAAFPGGKKMPTDLDYAGLWKQFQQVRNTVSRPIHVRRRGLPLQIAGVDFRLKIHIRFCRAYA